MASVPDIDRIDVEAVNSRQNRQLYKARQAIHPTRVSGVFRRLKWRIMALTMAIYYITPWIRWPRAEGAPDQAVLIDLEHRRFFFFFIEIWPQEFYYVAGLLIMAGIGLFLVTSVLGRAWCGYTCPQTVWVDLFVHVEHLLEGDRNARFRLDRAPWNLSKWRKRLLKYFIWVLISVATGGAWVFYFADAPTLLLDLLSGAAPVAAYGALGVLTATTFVFGGLMREQVCTYMCPWPRIQGAMTDENSLIVTYRDWRGEPRGRHRKSAEAASLGDCIDCNQCVAACPMGIDIRDGSQMECINCALCIDACNNVMARTGGKLNLIAYTGVIDHERPVDGVVGAEMGGASGGAPGGAQRGPLYKTVMRPRTAIYAGLWGLAGLAMLFSLLARDHLDLTVLADRNPRYVLLSDGQIRNGYTIKISNMEQRRRRVLLQIAGIDGALLTVAGQDAPPARTRELLLAPDKVRRLRVYVAAPGAALASGGNPLRFSVIDLDGPEQVHYGAHLVAPER